MSNNTNRRLVKEYNIIKTLIDKEIFTAPLKDNLLLWQAVLLGPDDTIWEGGCFKLSLEFPKDYPTNPPTVKFITKMFHPNNKDWIPMYDIIGLLRSILILLQEPNPDSPANTVAAKLFQENFQEYKNRVRQCVEESWIISDSFEYEKYSKEIID